MSTSMSPSPPLLSKTSRRRLLQMLGVGGGGFLLPSLRPRDARAAEAPQRFVLFYSYHGTLPQLWSPKAGTERDFELGELLAPLAPYKKDLVLLDGLDMKSWDVQKWSNPGNAHQQGQNHSLAAIDPVNADLAGGPTIDQVIAKGLSTRTALPSLEIGVNDRGGSFPSYHDISHPDRGQKLPSEADPRRVWKAVFDGYAPPSAGAPAPPAAPDARKRRGKSVLDYVRAEIAAVNPRLSGEDRKKLAAHQSTIADLERKLGLGEAGAAPAVAGAGCRSLPVADLGIPAAGSLGGKFWECLDAQIRIVQMAFACDRTRVVSVNVDELGDSVSGYVGGAFGTADLHDLAHKTSPRDGTLRNDPMAIEMMKKYHLAYATAFARLVKGLADMPDVDGKRLLDNTVVLWAGEVAEGNHDVHDLKWLLAGSAGGKIGTGRWLKCKNASHADLFVSLANVMGVGLTTFGNPATCTGKLAGI